MKFSEQDWDVIRLQQGDITKEEFYEKHPNSSVTRIMKGEDPHEVLGVDKATESGKTYNTVGNVIYPYFRPLNVGDK